LVSASYTGRPRGLGADIEPGKLGHIVACQRNWCHHLSSVLLIDPYCRPTPKASLHPLPWSANCGCAATRALGLGNAPLRSGLCARGQRSKACARTHGDGMFRRRSVAQALLRPLGHRHRRQCGQLYPSRSTTRPTARAPPHAGRSREYCFFILPSNRARCWGYECLMYE